MLGTSTVVLSFKMFSLYLLWVDFSSWNNGFRFMLLIDFSIFLKIHLFLWNEFKINFSKTYVCAFSDFWTEVQYDTCIRCSVELWNVKSYLHLLMINFYFFITIFNSDELLGIRYPGFNQFFCHILVFLRAQAGILTRSWLAERKQFLFPFASFQYLWITGNAHVRMKNGSWGEIAHFPLDLT